MTTRIAQFSEVSIPTVHVEEHVENTNSVHSTQESGIIHIPDDTNSIPATPETIVPQAETTNTTEKKSKGPWYDRPLLGEKVSQIVGDSLDAAFKKIGSVFKKMISGPKSTPSFVAYGRARKYLHIGINFAGRHTAGRVTSLFRTVVYLIGIAIIGAKVAFKYILLPISRYEDQKAIENLKTRLEKTNTERTKNGEEGLTLKDEKGKEIPLTDEYFDRSFNWEETNATESISNSQSQQQNQKSEIAQESKPQPVIDFNKYKYQPRNSKISDIREPAKENKKERTRENPDGVKVYRHKSQLDHEIAKETNAIKDLFWRSLDSARSVILAPEILHESLTSAAISTVDMCCSGRDLKYRPGESTEKLRVLSEQNGYAILFPPNGSANRKPSTSETESDDESEITFDDDSSRTSTVSEE